MRDAATICSLNWLSLMGFTINGADSLMIVVEASSELTHPDWLPASTDTLTAGVSHFGDPAWADHPGRFYRLRSP